MVEPHVIVPTSEIERLEEIEKQYHLLKNQKADLEGHVCDHSSCSKELGELKEKYEQIKEEKSKKEEKSVSSSDSESESDEDSKISRDKKKSNAGQSASKDSTPSSTATSTSRPWYYIGPLDEEKV